jgi:antitoxin HicB
MTLAYRIELEPDDNGTFLVTCPDIPGVVTYGETREEACRRAVDAIETMVAGLMAHGEEIPPPTSPLGNEVARLSLQTALKVQLYRALREAGMTRAELARRLGWHREQVDRLFRLDRASRLDQIEAALHAMGRELHIELRGAA